jgi:hypothetical protein
MFWRVVFLIGLTAVSMLLAVYLQAYLVLPAAWAGVVAFSVPILFVVGVLLIIRNWGDISRPG